MAPPDGTRSPRLPTLSWSSVVDRADASTIAADPAPLADDIEASSNASIVFEPLTLIEPLEDPSIMPVVPPVPVPAVPPVVSAPPVPPAPAPPVAPTAVTVAPPVPPAPVAVAAPVVPATASVAPSVTASPLDAPAAAVSMEVAADTLVRSTPPAVIVPALGDVTSGPESIAETPVTTVLPEIQEATPVASLGPVLPSIPAAAPRAATATPFAFDPASVIAPPAKQQQRRTKRRGLKLVVTLILLGGLVAAGVVFGRPYLAPSDSDDATTPYSETVETVRGVEFTEPLSVTAEPSAQFAGRLQAQLAPISADELAQWRALGLANGIVDEASLTRQLTGWQDALYSTVDAQVYRDLGAAGAGLDAELVQTMSAASLDQEFRWSADQARRTLDAAAATSAEVIGQARVVQAQSEFTAEVEPVPTDQIGAFPAVLGYRLLAPHVFADFTAPQTPNPLLDLGPLGPGPLGDDVAVAAGSPVMLDGDVVVDSPVAMDRSFWFLAFDGFLDGPTAFAASEAIVESSLTNATRGTTACVYATFSGGGVAQTDTLRSALVAWTDAAPVQFASSLTALPDGSLQLTSCDPGVGSTTAGRAGVAAELVAWRAVELATFEAVAASGGGDTEFANAWSLIGASSAPLDVAALPAGTPPADIATAAREAVALLYSSTG